MSVELLVPPLGESISEATLSKWLKNVGDAVKIDEPIAELETDKITVTLPAPQSGVLELQKHLAGTVVRIGDSIGSLNTTSAAVSKPPQSEKQESPNNTPLKQPAVQKTETHSALVPSPAPLTKGPALSPSKRQALYEAGGAATPASVVATAPHLVTNPSVAGPIEDVVPMSPMRKRIAERLVEAQNSAAILTTFNEVDMTQIMQLRSQYQESFTQKHGVKLGFMSFFVKACVDALKAFPGINAEVRGTDIVYKKHYDFGIAVGSGKGLVVPVMRGVDKLGFAEIEKNIVELGQKAKNNTLSLADLSGGTFSITNGGIYGSLMSTPLLNLPQTGILGMHNIVRRPIAVGDQVEIRPMMYIALSYDHRVVDGREAVQFLVHIKEHLEHPEKMLLSI